MIRILLAVLILTSMQCFANNEYSPELFRDELVETTLKNVSDIYPAPNLNYNYDDSKIKGGAEVPLVNYKPLKMRDHLVETTLKDVSGEYPEANLVYDYSNIRFVPLKIRFLERITTKKTNNFEGQIVKFVVTEDIFDGKTKLLSRGTYGTARIETLLARGAMGEPADIIISKFEIEGLDKKKIDGLIVRRGANLALLAGALKYSIGTVFPGTGYLFMLIKGGQAKIKTDEIFELKYLP